MLHARILGALGVALLLAACSSTTNNSSSSSSGSVGDGGSSGSSGDGGAGGLSFKPSNIDLTGWDLSQIGDVNLSGTNCIIDSETADGYQALLCDTDFSNHVAHKIVTLPDQTKLSVWVMKSLRIEASTVLSLSRGHIPVVLVTTGSMELLGSIDVPPGLLGGAFNSGVVGNTKGQGVGGGSAGDANGLSGGAASFCGLGGKAGTVSGAGTPPAPPAAYGTPELVPLVGGSAGGNGALTNDGAGGGAVQLVAGVKINLHAGAFINAGGGGGAFGGNDKQGAGGGGSGGAILLEAPVVQLDGNVGANGGGGGQGNGNAGDPGKADGVAHGGAKPPNSGVGPVGGDGSFGPNVNGADGPGGTTTSAGSGGGGAGRVRINTTAGAATIGGAVSPAASTPCFTQGKLGS
jgi:hypothetical protein